MKCVSLVLVLILGLDGASWARNTPRRSYRDDNQSPETSQTRTLKAEVQKRGVGTTSRVRVTLRSGLEVKGHISRIESTFFEVSDAHGNVTSVPYSNAQKVRGPGLSKGAKIGIAIGAAVAIVALVFAVGLKSAGY